MVRVGNGVCIGKDSSDQHSTSCSYILFCLCVYYLVNVGLWVPDYQSFSFQRVAYGGPDGIYYTSSVGRRSGGDGVSGFSC